MRPIKFRAWDKREKKMVFVGITQVGEAFIGGGDDRIDLGEEAIPMQYTGLKDKNGKEIYEGDMVSGKNIIEWSDDGYCTRSSSGSGIAEAGIRNDEIEVIGNIYENKELLNENSQS